MMDGATEWDYFTRKNGLWKLKFVSIKMIWNINCTCAKLRVLVTFTSNYCYILYLYTCVAIKIIKWHIRSKRFAKLMEISIYSILDTRAIISFFLYFIFISILLFSIYFSYIFLYFKLLFRCYRVKTKWIKVYTKFFNLFFT